MKGIIVNNILNVWHSSLRWALIIYLVVQILGFVPIMDHSVFSLVVFSIFPISLISSILDTQDKQCSEQYMISMPGGKGAMVKGMYVTTLLYLAIIFIIEIMIFILCYYFAPELMNLSRLYWLLALLVALPLIVLTLLFPIYYKFGMKVLRTAIGIFVALFMGASFVLTISDKGDEFYWNPGSVLFELNFGAEWVIPALILAGTIALYFGSMAASIKLYKSRK